MDKKSLWAQVEDIPDFRTPATILEEQASLLKDATNGVLLGRISRGAAFARTDFDGSIGDLFFKDGGSLFGFKLSIVAPGLNNYMYEVLSIAYHPLDVYPVYVQSQIHKEIGRDFCIECADETQFTAALGNILSSEKTRKAISNLKKQSEKTALNHFNSSQRGRQERSNKGLRS